MITSSEEFIRLRESENPEEYNRATNDSATIETWLSIINSHDDMKVWVALNKTVPIEILEILSADDSADVRHSVAMKRKISIQIFEKLSIDVDESVRLAIAFNPKTPKHILEKMQNDSWDRIVEIAKKRVEEFGNR